jgi:hypothetical protein
MVKRIRNIQGMVRRIRSTQGMVQECQEHTEYDMSAGANRWDSQERTQRGWWQGWSKKGIVRRVRSILGNCGSVRSIKETVGVSGAYGEW